MTGIYLSPKDFSKIAESCTYVLSLASIHLYPIHQAILPVIIPHMKHASSLAPAVVDTFLFFP